MNKKFLYVLPLILSLLLSTVLPVSAQQESELKLSLRKDFGYAWAGDIQGTFSMKVSGPQELVRVEFLIDGEVIGQDSSEPFQLQFNTGNYNLQTHTLGAIGYTSDGRTLNSNPINVDFVTSEQGWKATGTLVIPILVVVFGVMLLSFVLPWLMSRGKTKQAIPLGAPRNYGVAGGAICPKCQRSFSRNLFSPNLLVGKLDRCPHCGRWSLVRRATPIELAAAEAAELQLAVADEQIQTISEAERLQRDLEDSRYQDL
jgi:hypothetical protein